jgi:6-phosphogluconolactonase
MQKTQYYLAIGTYAPKDSPSIYLYSFDPQSAQLSYLSSFTGLENPSFLALNPQQNRLYAVSETMTFNGQPGGSVAAFSLNPTSAQLTLLNELPTYGGAPCHRTLSQDNAWLLVANYMGGNINLFPILSGGEIGPIASNIHHSGQLGPRTDRQEIPHPHSIPLDPTGKYAFVPDLGLDTIFTYKLDTENGKLVPYAETKTEPGSGPRHFTFHPSRPYAYVINELSSSVTVFKFDPQQVRLEALQSISTLPGDFRDENICADIHVSLDGNYLYGSNRGHNSIAVFSIQENGLLASIEYVSTRGKTPRNFALTPDGHFLLAANQDSDSIVTYSVNQDTGRLTFENSIQVPHPVCLKFAQIS